MSPSARKEIDSIILLNISVLTKSVTSNPASMIATLDPRPVFPPELTLSDPMVAAPSLVTSTKSTTAMIGSLM